MPLIDRPQRDRRPSIEIFEGRFLLNSFHPQAHLASHPPPHIAPQRDQDAPRSSHILPAGGADVTAVSSTADGGMARSTRGIATPSTLQPTSLLYSGPTSGISGQTVLFDLDLGTPGRTGIFSAVMGRNIRMYIASGASWVPWADAGTNHLKVSGHDAFGEAQFWMRLDAHGKPFDLQLKFAFAGDTTYASSSAQVTIHVH